MTDYNRPVAFDVIDTVTGDPIQRFQTSQQAMARCMELEPGEDLNHYRYVVRPIRATDIPDEE